MSKVRKVHKGEDVWPTTENQGVGEQPQIPVSDRVAEEDYYHHGNMQ